MKTLLTKARPLALALAALAASLIIASFPRPARADCAVGQSICTGRYVGYIGMRAALERNGQRVWILRQADGTYTEVGAAVGTYEDARPLSAEAAAAQTSKYNQFYAPRRLMSRAEYEGTTFKNFKTQLPLVAPGLRGETAYVSVQDNDLIQTASDIVLAEYFMDPRVQVPAGGALLLDRNGNMLASSPSGAYSFLSDFITNRSSTGRSAVCGGAVGDLLTFEQCPLKNLSLTAPLRGVEVDSSSHWGFGDAKVTTDSTGRYVLDYRYAAGWTFIQTVSGYDPLRLGLAPTTELQIFPMPIANPIDNFWVMMRYNKLEPRIKLGGLHIEERQTNGGRGEAAWDTQHIGIEVSMLVGTAFLYNEPRGDFWAGDIPPGPVPIDDVSHRTEYSFVRPPPPPQGQDPLPDLKDRGFLKQINRADLSNTDVYVFDMAGSLLSERNGLKANETDGLVCDTPDHCTLPAGDYQARFNFQGMVKDPGFDGRVKLVVVNRATGYIGTGFATKRGTGLPLLVADDDIVMRPPNLTIKLQRRRKDRRVQTIGFEGSGLTSDTLIVAETTWTDWDGTPLPANLTAGFTGRIARVVEPNKLAPDVQGGGTSGSGLFPILPGKYTQVVKLPNASDLAHFYLHVSPQAIEKNPDFSELTDGGTPLQYRPAHYAPFKVQIFDAPEDIEPGEDLSPWYEDVYRPEQHFSLLDLKPQSLDVVTDQARTNILEKPGATITGDITSIEFLYNLAQDSLPELQRFGSARTYVLTVGGVDKEVTFGSDNLATWTAADLGGDDVEPSDLFGIRLLQEGDEGNVLAEYGLSLFFGITPDNETGDRQVSADENVAEIQAEARIGLNPVDPGNEVRWEFLEGSGPLSSPTSPTDDEGLAYVSLETSHHAGDTYRVTGYLDKVVIDGKPHTLDPPYRATTTTIRVIAGHIPPTGFQGVASRQNFPADGTTLVTMDVLLHDSWGNLPEEGTPVTWLLDGHGTFDVTQDEVTGGRTGALMRAPVIAGEQKVAIVVDGVKSPPTIFRANTVVGRLDANATQILIGSQQAVTMTATFKDVEGNPVAAGTPVYWLQTNGTLTFASDTSGAGFTNDQGVATAMLTAPKNVANIGLIRTIATAAGATGNSPVIEAYSNDANTMRVDRTALVMKPGPYVVEAPSRQLFTDSLVNASEAIPVWSETPVELKGAPGQRPKVTLQDFGIGPLLTIDGLNADGTATIGNDGRARLTIKRRPNAAFSPSLIEGLPSGPAYTLACMDLDADGTCEWETKIGVVAEESAQMVGGFAWGFVTGQVTDNATAAGDFAASWATYGDVRDLTVTGLQLYHIVPGEPNPVVATMSAASLVPIPGINEATAITKVAVKKLVGMQLAGALVGMVHAMNKKADREAAKLFWNEVIEPLTEAIGRLDKKVLESLDKVYKEEKSAEAAARVYARLKNRFGSDTADAFLVRMARYAEDPALGANAADYMTRLFHGMDDRTLHMFASLSTQEGDEIVGYLAKVAGHVDPGDLGRVLGNNVVFDQVKAGAKPYTQKHLIRDLADLAGTPGLADSTKMLKVTRNQVHGFKLEIQFAAAAKRGEIPALKGCTVTSMTVRKFMDFTLGELMPLKTDIDTLLSCPGKGAVAAQVKRGSKALTLKSLRRWSQLVAKKMGLSREKQIVVVTNTTEIKPDVLKFLKEAKDKAEIEVVRIEELNPFD